MPGVLDQALELRAAGKLEDSRALLLDWVAAAPGDAVALYQCAWAHDVLGLEKEAAPYYERAIEAGLSGEDLRGAFVGLGSTYRCLGRYEESEEVLRRGSLEFPEDWAIRVFLSMTLHNLGRHAEAMRILLECAASTSSDPFVKSYRRAIQFYSDKLDQTWS